MFTRYLDRKKRGRGEGEKNKEKYARRKFYEKGFEDRGRSFRKPRHVIRYLGAFLAGPGEEGRRGGDKGWAR